MSEITTGNCLIINKYLTSYFFIMLHLLLMTLRTRNKSWSLKIPHVGMRSLKYEKLELSYYPWRCLEGEEIQLLLIHDLGTRWG